MDTADWEKAGLYLPGTEGAADRLALLEFLRSRGATIAQMVEADAAGGLPGLAGDLVLGPPNPLTVAEVATRCGVTEEQVGRVLLAMGLPAGHDTELPHHMDRLMAAYAQGAAIMGEEPILAFTRVLGAAATRIAEAAVALFNAELGPGSERQGSDEVAQARVAEAAMLAFTTVPEVLTGVLLAQFHRANRRAVEANRGPARQGSEETVTLGFVDLVGSTAWAEGQSLRDSSLALSRFASCAWATAVQAGGRVVKMIGDEVFFAAPSVDAACRIGLEICAEVAADPLLPPARGAVGYGAATPSGGDYFGPLVNLVSRLAKRAYPNTLIVTGEAADALPHGSWTLTELAPLTVRGIANPIPTFEVARAPVAP